MSFLCFVRTPFTVNYATLLDKVWHPSPWHKPLLKQQISSQIMKIKVTHCDTWCHRKSHGIPEHMTLHQNSLWVLCVVCHGVLLFFLIPNQQVTSIFQYVIGFSSFWLKITCDVKFGEWIPESGDANVNKYWFWIIY